MRKRNYESARFNLVLDPVANQTLKELQEKTKITTLAELVRRAIRSYYMLARLNEDGACIQHKDGTVEPLMGLL